MGSGDRSYRVNVSFSSSYRRNPYQIAGQIRPRPTNGIDSQHDHLDPGDRRESAAHLRDLYVNWPVQVDLVQQGSALARPTDL